MFVFSSTERRASGRPRSAGRSQARALISTTTRGGKDPRPAAPGAIRKAGQPLVEEPLAPTACALAARGESHTDLVFAQAAGREKTTWARKTSRVVAVWRRTHRSRVSRSALVSSVRYGLRLDTAPSFLEGACGGDLFASGWRRCVRPCVVGVDDPERTGQAVLYRVELSRGGLATSGDARRFVRCRSKKLGHVLDPRTGWPVEDAPRSVTGIAPTCLEAGTFSTLAYPPRAAGANLPRGAGRPGPDTGAPSAACGRPRAARARAATARKGRTSAAAAPAARPGIPRTRAPGTPDRRDARRPRRGRA
jgi:ApbE family